MGEITQQQVRDYFDYDPETGVLTRKDPKARCKGQIASGYLRLSIHGKLMASHVLIWLHVYGEMPDRQIDHKNLNKLDNRLENLRLATRSQQIGNNRIRVNNNTGVKGVCVRKRKKPYDARITVEGKEIYLGSHETLDEAAHAYNKAAIQYFGEFACLNPIGQDKEVSHAK